MKAIFIWTWVGLLALLLAACASASAGHRPAASAATPTGLSPAVKQFQARLNAFDNAHPGLVNCQATVLVMLTESWLDMQHGGPGITPADAAYKYGQNSVIANVYPPFYDALTNYADNHGLQANFTMTAVTTDQGQDVLLDNCLTATALKFSDLCLLSVGSTGRW